MTRYTEPTSYAFAWHCTAPPSLAEFDFPPGESPGDYGSIVDYIKRRAETVPCDELFEAVAGGKEAVLDSLLYGRESYVDLDIADDWAASWHKSHYPDSTPVYYFAHSGIEHVFEPIGYRRETANSAE